MIAFVPRNMDEKYTADDFSWIEQREDNKNLLFPIRSKTTQFFLALLHTTRMD